MIKNNLRLLKDYSDFLKHIEEINIVLKELRYNLCNLRHEEILHYVGQEKFQDLALKHFLQTGGTS